MNTPNPLRLLLVDDHEVVRRGLIDLLSADEDLEVVGEAGSVAEAMARIPALQPDVAVLDVRLPDGNGIELCRDLLSRLPDLRCLMLTSITHHRFDSPTWGHDEVRRLHLELTEIDMLTTQAAVEHATGRAKRRLDAHS